MILCDSHLHSEFSFDSESTLDAICHEYIKKSFSRIALTDHYDIDGTEDGLYPPYKAKEARRSFECAAERYSDRLGLVWGIELGQPQLRAQSAKRFIRENGFEFVIGSVHNLELCPDFYFLNFSKMPDEMIRRLYARYVDALTETASFGGIHTLAHITYPMRYIHRDGRDLDIREFYDSYRRLFHILIENGTALELNTGKVRTGYVTSPDVDLIRLYRDCGGRRVTVGSDAHKAGDYGADIETGIKLLRSEGFSELVIPSPKGTETITI